MNRRVFRLPPALVAECSLRAQTVAQIACITNSDANTLSVIDTGDRYGKRTIPVSGEPGGAAVPRDGSKVLKCR
jgi:YVTN family beta-propeller protein